MSLFLDAGYRIFQGQSIYQDFYFHAGPLHPYWHALFFKLFGFGTAAILSHLATINAAQSLIIFSLARRHLPAAPSLLATAVSSIAFYGPYSHPWYDQNAALWIFAGCLIMDRMIQVQDKTTKKWRLPLLAAACGVCAALAIMTKANIGVAGAAAFMAALMVTRRPWPSLGYFALGLLTGLAGISLIFIPSLKEFLYQTLIAYAPTSRLGAGKKLWFIIHTSVYALPALLAFAMAALGGWNFIKANRERWILLAGILATSFFAVWTGTMVFEGHQVFLGLALAFVLILAWNMGFRHAQIIAAGGSLFLLSHACLHTINLTAWTWRQISLDSAYSFQSEPLRGWSCHEDPCRDVDNAVAFIEQKIPASDTFFVFPDATVLYALSGRKSFSPAPVLFDHGVLLQGRLYQNFHSHFLKSPPKWILLRHQTQTSFNHTERLLKWLDLKNFITEHYEPIAAWGSFQALRLKS